MSDDYRKGQEQVWTEIKEMIVTTLKVIGVVWLVWAIINLVLGA